MKIAHISDLHFSKISWDPLQFFSKRILGNLNLLLKRKNVFSSTQPFTLLKRWKELGVSDVIISGDLTTTSSREEFRIATRFVDAIKEMGIEPHIIPGNHDHYTRRSYRKKLFYDYFPLQFGIDIPSFNLKEHGVTAKKLDYDWWLVGLDTAVATPLLSSGGLFSKKVEKNLNKILDEIPKQDKILLVNHFPFFKHEIPRRRLKKGEALQKVIENHPNIFMYIHGHTHRRTLGDLRKNGLPIVTDSGSAAYLHGSWNLITLTPSSCEIKVYEWQKEWREIKKEKYEWTKKTP